jgi:hypothetical protein
MKAEGTLALRLGLTTHVSPLRLRLARLSKRYPSSTSECLEDWLIDVANVRGARIVTRPMGLPPGFVGPPAGELTTEALVVALCMVQSLDRPQMLRLAAQFISRGAVEVRVLSLVAERERAGSILGAMALQALRIDPLHVPWRALADTFGAKACVRDAIIHWTRLAEPLMRHHGGAAGTWRLVA